MPPYCGPATKPRGAKIYLLCEAVIIIWEQDQYVVLKVLSSGNETKSFNTQIHQLHIALFPLHENLHDTSSNHPPLQPSNIYSIHLIFVSFLARLSITTVWKKRLRLNKRWKNRDIERGKLSYWPHGERQQRRKQKRKTRISR